jgi:excisionase family DNA binding protein
MKDGNLTKRSPWNPGRLTESCLVRVFDHLGSLQRYVDEQASCADRDAPKSLAAKASSRTVTTMPGEAQLLDMAPTAPAGLVDAAEAGRLLSVPASWVLAEARADRIPHVRLGRYVRFNAAELEDWWQGRARGPSRPRHRDVRASRAPSQDRRSDELVRRAS